MNILITAGGTIEKIDDVRAISNNSTGKLGVEVAEAFILSGRIPVDKIFYVCGQNAAVPLFDKTNKIEIIRIVSVSDLAAKLESILTNEKIDVLVHSMAVSDYTVDTLTTKSKILSSVASLLTNEASDGLLCPDKPISENTSLELATKIVESFLSGTDGIEANNKISSDLDDLIIVMKKTPKIISMIKKLQPETILVGFKLLSNVDLDTLINTAYKLLNKNNCDLVLANDLSHISGDTHVGYLVRNDKTYKRMETKAEIAKAIVLQTAELLESRK